MAIVSDQRLGGPGMAGPAYDRIVVAAPHLVHAHASRCRWPTLEHRHHRIRIATALPQGERGRTTPDLPRMLDPHNTHGAMPTRCPSYSGVGALGEGLLRPSPRAPEDSAPDLCQSMADTIVQSSRPAWVR